MPPKVENIATLVAKRNIAITSLDELYEEFNLLYQAEPVYQAEIQKLLEQEFIVEIEQVNHNIPECQASFSLRCVRKGAKWKVLKRSP